MIFHWSQFIFDSLNLKLWIFHLSTIYEILDNLEHFMLVEIEFVDGLTASLALRREWIYYKIFKFFRNSIAKWIIGSMNASNKLLNGINLSIPYFLWIHNYNYMDSSLSCSFQLLHHFHRWEIHVFVRCLPCENFFISNSSMNRFLTDFQMKYEHYNLTSFAFCISRYTKNIYVDFLPLLTARVCERF